MKRKEVTLRLKTALLTAVIAGSLAAPSVADASAHGSARSGSAKKADVRSQDGNSPTPIGDPIGVVQSIISEIEFDLSPQNLQTILWDLPGFGPYGSL
jgi:hypothetical protein